MIPYRAITDVPRGWRWPGGAGVAVMVVLNVEWFPLDGQGISLFSRTQSLVPDTLNHSWRDYGLRVGWWRVLDHFQRRDISASVALNADVVAQASPVIESIKQMGWEVVAHGTTNSRRLTGMSPATEEREIRAALQLLTEGFGSTPRGWFGPGAAETFNTLPILARVGVDYVMDYCNDDLPYEISLGQERLWAVPYSIEVNDGTVLVEKGASADEFAHRIRQQFKVLAIEGESLPRVMAIGLHPFMIGQAFRIEAVVDALADIRQDERAWFAAPGEVLDAFRTTVPNLS